MLGHSLKSNISKSPSPDNACRFILSIVVWCLLFFMPVTALSQPAIRTAFSAGYGFNRNFMLAGKEVKGSGGLIFCGGGNVMIPVGNTIFVSGGLHAKTIFASGRIGVSRYRAQTVRLAVPLQLGLKLGTDFELSAGCMISHNRDFVQFHIRKPHSMRYDLLAQFAYLGAERWFLTLKIMHNVGTPHGFLTNDPKTAILPGVSYRLKTYRNQQ